MEVSGFSSSNNAVNTSCHKTRVIAVHFTLSGCSPHASSSSQLFYLAVVGGVNRAQVKYMFYYSVSGEVILTVTVAGDVCY